MVQSAAIGVLLVASGFDRFTPLLIVAIVATVAVKIFIAPYFFYGLIRRHQLKFSVNTYLNTPVTRCSMIAGSCAADAERLLLAAGRAGARGRETAAPHASPPS